MEIEQPNDYSDIIGLIERAKNSVNAYVNRELISMYWNIGEYIGKKTTADGWGKQTVKSLADFLANNYPDARGFSAQNLWRMKQFYGTYKDDEKLSPLVRELSWTIYLAAEIARILSAGAKQHGKVIN